ncbi:MAG: NAD(+)/NADH kinase, partial [Clostridia bacterium]|nr:NAD(+)/NADH kinase [Clostridia bacterium]
PICTHSLFARSLLFRPEKTFRVVIRNPELCRPLLSCDGEETLHIAPGSTFEIRRAHRNCKIIRIKAESFTDTLSRKMVERRV